MIHGSSILTPSPSSPCDPAFHRVAQLRCILSPSFLLHTRFLPDFPSETTTPGPSRDTVSRPSNHVSSASHPPALVPSPSPHL